MHAILGYDLHMAKDTYTCCDVKLQVVGLHSLQHNQNWYYSLHYLQITQIIHIEARLMLIINPPSTMPLRLVVRLTVLDLRSSAFISSILARRRNASSLNSSRNVSSRSNFAAVVDTSASNMSSVDTIGFDRRRE